MQIYLVGGAVRDKLLGLKNTDKDYVVVGSSVNEMLKLGYIQVGKDFPVFLHPKTKEEYALARLERKVAKGYTGFEFNTSSVTLEQDLSRRDLTINSMAIDKKGHLIDPFNGKQDIKNKLLRHTSNAFNEDPVRVLRIARFAAKFAQFDFKIDKETQKIIKQMVIAKELDNLSANRIFIELKKALNENNTSKFFEALSSCNAYERVFFPLENKQNYQYLDTFDTSNDKYKFVLWLMDESLSSIKKLCKNIACPKKYQELAILFNNFYQFTQNFEHKNTQEIFTFFAKTDALRRRNRFFDLLNILKLLHIDTTSIVTIFNALNEINITKLDKNNIGEAITKEKKNIIKSFLNSAN